jgi:hypothetical protein
MGVCNNASADETVVARADQPDAVIITKPTRLMFGTQTAGVISANTKTVTLLNSGSKIRQINSVETSGNYSIAGNTCTGSLEPKGKCQITVAITPRCPGAQPGELSIVHDSGSALLS